MVFIVLDEVHGVWISINSWQLLVFFRSVSNLIRVVIRFLLVIKCNLFVNERYN
jgi:hypothetical protein